MADLNENQYDENKTEITENEEEVLEEEVLEEESFGFIDKFIGIFTEPVSVFKNIMKNGVKFSDWFVPIIFVAVFAILANYMMLRDPEIKAQFVEQQMTRMEKMFDSMASNPNMTKKDIEATKEKTLESLEKNSGSLMSSAFGLLGALIVITLIVLLLSLYFFLCAKLFFKSQAGYKEVLGVYASSMYVSVLGIIAYLIAGMLLTKFMQGFDVASLIGQDKSTFVGFLLSRLDIFTIWFYILLSIGLATISNSENRGKFYGLVFGSWIGWSFIWHLVVSAVPFLANFGG